MQCPSCQFENMPGAAVCGRCSASLQLSATTIDVHPPRANARTRRMRLWLPAHALVARTRSRMHPFTESLAPTFSWNRPEAGVLLRMAVPGWPQRYLGRVARGRVFFWFYIVLVLMGLVALGTTGGTFALGLALSVHISSILDIYWAGTPDWPSRLINSAATIVVVGAAIYLPTYWTATQVMGVRRINITASPLEAGDTLLFLRGTVGVGDVVVYQIPHEQINTRQAGNGEPVYYQMRGEYIDRIIAAPGQMVSWKDQHLLVDGQPSPWQPLHAAAIRADLEFSVPQDCYGILPSTQAPNAPSFPPQFWQTVSIVPRGSVEGRVWLRRHASGLWGRL